jgi:hypothetical protein
MSTIFADFLCVSLPNIFRTILTFANAEYSTETEVLLPENLIKTLGKCLVPGSNRHRHSSLAQAPNEACLPTSVKWQLLV